MAAMMKAIAALARRFELAPAETPVVNVQRRRWRGLRVANLGLLVPHDCGGEIIDDAHVCPLPRAPGWCRGLINLRGKLIPAFDLHERLGLAHLRAQKQWWLALGAGDDCLAFPIDALPVSLMFDEAAAVATIAVPELLRPWTGATFPVGGELWLEFRPWDFFRALTQQEHAA